MRSKINVNFKTEYEDFLCEFILPLLGIDIETNRAYISSDIYFVGDSKPLVEHSAGKLSFYVSGWHLFSIPCAREVSDDDLAVARRILQSFPNIAEYKKTGSSRYMPSGFLYDSHKKALYRTITQNGIGHWLSGDNDDNQMSKLFDELETWAVKTYEGKKVSMGFIINPYAKSYFHVGDQTWLTFMRDDAAAMLTDCIHSVIELDPQCNFISYHSLSSDNTIPGCELNYKAPLRFSQIIQTFVTGKKCGIFLLNNGDIVLAKEQEIRFVKRNLRWLNMSYRAFRNALQPFVDKNYSNMDEETAIRVESLLESIYASVLDVSFSHAGGIIAVVGSMWPGSIATETDKNPILAPSDDLISTSFDTTGNMNDIRMLKRALLKLLIKDESFDKLDRKLRGELLGLDGACILSCDGRVQSFGAIIQNDSGSIGGGRGAAAKKLSEYGMAVKISTDGYIELYVDGKLAYSIK